MDLLETIDYALEHEDMILPKKETEDKVDLFSRMANFIINLEPDDLSDNQVQEVINMIETLEDEYDIQEVRKPRLARRTPQTKNQSSKKWYRKNRTEIKRRKAKFRRSAEGRKRMMKKERLARQGKTATGRRKVRYHVRKKSDRRRNNE